MANTNVIDVSINFERFRVRDYIAFMEAANSGNFKGMAEGLSRVVESWSLEGDPTNPETYMDLSVPQWVAVTKIIAAQMSQGFSQGN